MPTDPKTGFDVHIPSGTMAKVLPWIAAAVFGLGTGGGASTWWDVAGARAYKDSLSEKVSHVSELEDEVTALKAQNAQLLRLLDNTVIEVECQ